MSNSYRWMTDKVILGCFVILTLLGVAWYSDITHKPIISDGEPDTIAQLQGRYQSYNEVFFHNSLPKDVYVSYEILPGRLAETQRNNGKFEIKLNPNYIRSQRHVAQALLHESCHIVTWDEVPLHGPQWQGCMLNLALHGAMADIW